MTIQASPYELIRAIQDQQRATDRLVSMLVGMLDKSGPEPLLSGGPIELPQLRRINEESARPGETIEIDGRAVHTTRRRAKLLSMVMSAPMTLSAMARAGVSPTVAGMKAQIRDTNTDLERAGVTRRVRMQAIAAQRRGAKGGREPALYALLEPKVEPETAGSAAQLSGNAAGTSPVVEAAENEDVDGSASARPHSAESDPAIPSMPGDAGTGQGSEAEIRIAVVPPGEMAGSAVRDGAQDSGLATGAAVAEARPPEASPPQPPADDASPSKGERVLDMWANTNFTAKLIAEKAGCALSSVSAFVSIARKAGDPRADARTPEALAARRAAEEHAEPTQAAPVIPASPIEPGDLLAVDIKAGRVSAPRGSYEGVSVQMARALDMLKGGQMFGLDAIAKKAGWQSPEVARNALLLERNRLTQRGVDLYLDKFNARLREAS